MAAGGPGLVFGRQQRQALEQALSPLTLQRLNFLQLPLPALNRELRQKAEQNPFLVYEPPRRDESLEALAEPELARNDTTGDLDYYNGSREGFGDQRDPAAAEALARRHDFQLLSQTAPETLYRHLERQVLQQTGPGERQEFFLFLCDALDADGYLRTPARQLLEDWRQLRGGETAFGSERAIARGVRAVQSLDPVGVGARNLAECLKLQVRADPAYSAERSLRLRLCDHLGGLLAKTPAQLAKDLRCSPEELQRALAYLRTLNPAPGRAFAAERPLEVPEVTAVRAPDGRWVAVCETQRFPLFRIDEEAVGRAKASPRLSREERAQTAAWESQAQMLAEAYAGRNETLRQVAQAVFDRQKAFLDSAGDPATLLPLLQRDVAQALGCDESVVSRAVKDKVVLVKASRKLLPLRRFFARPLPREAPGEAALSEQSAKRALREAVAAEPTDAPLSDQALAESLARQGMVLARRTVAKYREQLGIPSTRERRRRPAPPKGKRP